MRTPPSFPPLAAGVAVFLVGWTGRIWAHRHLGYRLRRHRKRLTTCGPYRWVRNPIYIANTLVVTGTTLTTGDYWLAAATALLCCVVYSLTVHWEEGALARWYGARYVEYARVTPRWIPSTPASPEVVCTGTRPWGDVAMAEWHVPLILAPVLIPLVLR
jgi:protein-S-isoprenylcysteine O-methyltransferase Ste14